MSNSQVGKVALTHWLYFNISGSIHYFGVLIAVQIFTFTFSDNSYLIDKILRFI